MTPRCGHRLARHVVVVGAALVLAAGLRQLPVVQASVSLAEPAQPEAALQVAAHPFYLPDGYGIAADSDLRTPSGLSAGQINALLSGTPLAGLGSTFLDAEQRYHVNARYLVAHACEESSWGRSEIAQTKHNLYGYGAVNSDPLGGAASFPDFASDIEFQAQVVSRDWLSPAGKDWGGAPTLEGMHVHYATDPHWVYRILAVAQMLPPPA